MADSTLDAPEVSILLLGDAEVGKSTFLSYVLSHYFVHFVRRMTISQPFRPNLTHHANQVALLSRLTLGNRGHASKEPLPTLRDLDQPFPFNIRMYNRPYRFEFYDTASPQNYTLLKPSVVVLCYSIADRDSLKSVHTRWKTLVETHFNDNEMLPVILLGLKGDVRSRED